MSSSQADPPDRSFMKTRVLLKRFGRRVWGLLSLLLATVALAAVAWYTEAGLDRWYGGEQPPTTAAVVEEVREKEDADPPASDNTTTDCHPAYEPCLPNLPGNALDCSDLSPDQKPVTITVIGIDPYNLDANNDGQACFVYPT